MKSAHTPKNVSALEPRFNSSILTATLGRLAPPPELALASLVVGNVAAILKLVGVL